jgi:hypothetical protein
MLQRGRRTPPEMLPIQAKKPPARNDFGAFQHQIRPLGMPLGNFKPEVATLTDNYAAMRECACCHAMAYMDTGIWYT